MLKYRSWWALGKKFDKGDNHFVWTQWLKRKILKCLPVDGDKQVEETKNTNFMMYNRLEGNSSISNKKDLFINLTEYYKATNQNPLDSIPLTFLIK